MKFFAVAALAATALAASTGLDSRGTQCTPPSYVCKPDNSGWLVCNVDGTFLDAGVCPKGTKCTSIDNLPYCV
ncbi:hypothetical protein GGS24DRAFT_317237 [Hypoxylon argillaceum]|nr:hypothetical protein GGS24DRAFT_317237 [Hypoxylon argillaceum]KAI1146465.1 hypothetical protein F4825DRAFT_194771 [Nemania diffusa]